MRFPSIILLGWLTFLVGCSQQEQNASPTTTNQPPVVLTARAAEQVKRMLTNERRPSGTMLRVAVKQGGGTGFIYDMKLDDVIAASDTRGWSSGILVVVDRESWPYLVGTLIDYEVTPNGAGFRFQNPNAK